jgi:predicted Zn-dependent protease
MSGSFEAIVAALILGAIGGLVLAMLHRVRPRSLVIGLALGALASATLPPGQGSGRLVQATLLEGARMLVRQGRAGAVEDLFRATRHAPGADPVALGSWGNVLLEAGRPAAATQAFEQAIGLAGPGTPLHMDAARARLATGDARGALNHLGRLYQHHGHEPVVGLLTGRALLETGNPGAARRALERAWRDLDRGGAWLWKPEAREVAEGFDRLAALYRARGWEALRQEAENRKRRALEPSG